MATPYGRFAVVVSAGVAGDVCAGRVIAVVSGTAVVADVSVVTVVRARVVSGVTSGNGVSRGADFEELHPDKRTKDRSRTTVT